MGAAVRVVCTRFLTVLPDSRNVVHTIDADFVV